MRTNNYDLVLCGGGVIGLSIAYQCLRQGWRVCVVDRGEPGMQSSWAGAGILPSGALNDPLDHIEQLRALSHPLHREWSKELKKLTGIDNEYRACGGLYLGRSAAERATLVANTLWWDEHEIPYERWTYEQACKVVPSLPISKSDNEATYWWMPNDCRVRNPFHLKALVQAIKLLGGTIVDHDEVVAIDPRNANEIHFQLRSGTTIVGSKACVSAGAWTQFLLDPFNVHTGVLPVRGQMLLYKAESPLFDCVINDGHRYLMPRDDGHILAGSCEEEVGFDTNTTPSMIEDIRSWAEEMLPILKEIPLIRNWAGLRPGSFDAYPYLGEAPGIPGLYIASGHFRHGLHWSTGTALLMQQLMFNEPTSIDLRPFRILRGNNSKS